jgi:two-component system, NtrC family, response regulator AtoC
MAEKADWEFRITILAKADAVGPAVLDPLKERGYDVRDTADVEVASNLLSSQDIDVLIADIDCVGPAYLDFLKSSKRASKETAIILLAGGVKLEFAFEAARLGAYQFMTKPVDPTGLLEVVDKALYSARLKREARAATQIVVGYREADRFVIGKSDLMQKIAEVIDKIAMSKASTVLIQGDSGTGKELVAKAIHFKGSGKGRPFMEINCASLPENLLETELFGYEKGAFTDAKARKQGLVELAEGGTLFLDEVGEMPVGLQTRLLRLLETKRFRRVGGVEDIEVSTRIIAATNRDLSAAKAQGKFRDDLYFRLMVIPIYVPALRERKEDVPILASYFIDHFNKELARSVLGLSKEAVRVMMAYDWPGNVRELRNVIERAILLESKDLILAEHLPREILERAAAARLDSGSSSEPGMPITLVAAEGQAVIQALKWAGGNKSKAARALGISRQTLRQKLKGLGLTSS